MKIKVAQVVKDPNGHSYNRTEMNERELRDFVAWVRIRLPISKEAPVNRDVLELVAAGVERFLNGKSPWPKAKGNKAKPEIMWRAFWYCYFDDSEYAPLLTKRHKSEGGLYVAVGNGMNLSPDAVESLVAKAKKLYETEQGKINFSHWLAKEKGAAFVSTYPPGTFDSSGHRPVSVSSRMRSK